jgi:hypothetical protein
MTPTARFLALVALPLLAALAVHYSLTLLSGWGVGPSFFFALAVGVLLHCGATKLYLSHFPGEEEGEPRLPARRVGAFWTTLFTLCLFSCVGAGVAWVAFHENPLCHVLTLAAGALTYRLLFPLFGPGNGPQRASARNPSHGLRERGEAGPAAAEVLPFGKATEAKEEVSDFVPNPAEHRHARPWSTDDLDLLDITVNGAEGKKAGEWLQELRGVGNFPNEEEAAGEGPAAKLRQANKARRRVWRVK